MESAFYLNYIKNGRAQFDPFVCSLQMSLKYRKFSLPNEKRQYYVKGSKHRSCNWERGAAWVPVSPWEGWMLVVPAVVPRQPVPCATWCWSDCSAMCMSRTLHSLLILLLLWRKALELKSEEKFWSALCGTAQKQVSAAENRCLLIQVYRLLLIRRKLPICHSYVVYRLRTS